jgi:hypothetical protein
MTVMRVQVSPAAREGEKRCRTDFKSMERRFRFEDDIEGEEEEEFWSKGEDIGKDEMWKEAESKKPWYRKVGKRDRGESGEVEEERGEEEGD